MSNSTAAVTSGPARQPRPASSAPAMKRRSKARSKANSFRPRGRFLRRADALGRPVREEGSADDPLLGDGAPDTAVGGVATVVAHHKKVTWRNRDFARLVTRFARSVRTNEGFVLPLTVDVDPAFPNGEVVPRHPDDALDEVRVGPFLRRLLARRARTLSRTLDRGVVVRALRGLEHEDVAAIGIAEARRHPVDEHALADIERRLHRLARNPERLDQELLDAERQAESDDDDDDELDKRALSVLVLAGTAGVTGHRRRLSGHRRRSRRGRVGGSFVGCTVGSLRVRALGVGIDGRRGVLRLGGLVGLTFAACLCGGGIALAILRRRALLGGGLGLRGRVVDIGLLRKDRRIVLAPAGVERLGVVVHHRCGRWSRVLALADASPATDATAEVVELGSADVAAGGHLDALDLRRVHGERALHADAERLLADRERLPSALALALDDDSLEDLCAAAGALDDLEVDLHAVTGLKGRHLAQLGALEGVDYSAHRKERARGHEPPDARRAMVAKGRRRDRARAGSAIGFVAP